MEAKFTQQQSLEVINSMIAQARGRVGRGDGSIMLLWGYVVALTSLVHFLLPYFGVEYSQQFNPNDIWLVGTTIGMAITLVMVFMRKRKPQVRTYAGSIGHWIWVGFFGCCIIIAILFGGRNGMLIYPVVSLVYTYGLSLSVKTFRFGWMYINVAICAVITVCYKFVPQEYYSLLMAGMMIAGNIIPGHIINVKGRRNV